MWYPGYRKNFLLLLILLSCSQSTASKFGYVWPGPNNQIPGELKNAKLSHKIFSKTLITIVCCLTCHQNCVIWYESQVVLCLSKYSGFWKEIYDSTPVLGLYRKLFFIKQLGSPPDLFYRSLWVDISSELGFKMPSIAHSYTDSQSKEAYFFLILTNRWAMQRGWQSWFRRWWRVFFWGGTRRS